MVRGSVTHILNGIWTATATIPIDRAPAGTADYPALVGTPMRIEIDELDTDLDFHGLIKHVSAESGEDAAEEVEYSAEDPRELWAWRLARNGPGTSIADDVGAYVGTTYFQDLLTGPQIIQDILYQSINGAVIGDLGAGEMGIDISSGTFETSGPDISGAPATAPMSIEDVVALITSTGQTDVILRPINVGTFGSPGFQMAEVNCYNGDYGTDRTGSVLFNYDEGGNVRHVSTTFDMDKTMNKLRYLLGLRLDDTHWRRSIERTNTDWPPSNTDLPTAFPNVDSRIGDSRTNYFTREEVRTYDTYGSESNFTRLYQWLWLVESYIRAQPRQIFHVTPVRGIVPGTGIPTFDIGDLVHVQAWTNFVGGVDAAQRVYQRVISWDENGTLELGELQTASDGENP